MFQKLQAGVEIRVVGGSYQLFLNGGRLFLQTGHNRFGTYADALKAADQNHLTRPTCTI